MITKIIPTYLKSKNRVLIFWAGNPVQIAQTSTRLSNTDRQWENVFGI